MDETAPPRRGRRRSGLTLLVGFAIVALVLVGVAVLASRSAGDQPLESAGTPTGLQMPSLQDRPDPRASFPLPAATLAPFGDGDPVDVAALQGAPLVVNFWATWCAPCVEEMPDFQRVASRTEGEVRFLGVDVMDAPSNAEPFVKELGITYLLAVDREGEYWREVGSFGMPTTLFVQPDGTVVYRHTGPLDASELRRLLEEHLGVRT